jgi:SanA protein
MKRRKFIKYFLGICVFVAISVIIINLIVITKSKKYIYSNVKEVPECYNALVLGALVSNSGYPSSILLDRMDVAIDLYRNNKIKRFLLSGDHGTIEYDEVNSMKNYLLKNGIDVKDIFLDHAGFNTYNSIVRAKEIFQVKKVIIVTQEFHLSRAVYIARNKGLDAYGMIADKRVYSSINNLKIREVFANIKAFGELLINRKPRFLGNKIPITGDSQLSFD